MKIAIVGAGKIGKCLGELAEKFSEVIYLDVNPPYSNDYTLIKDCDLVFICVNTTDFHQYDTSNVESCLRNINENEIQGEVVVVSTCPPSFFDGLRDDIVYSPLFIRQGSIAQDIIDAEMVLIGSKSTNLKLVDFYSKIRSDYNFIYVSPKEAAVVKMGINGFLCTKVAYANMIGDFCVSQGLDEDAVLDAISQCKTVNPKYFKYGDGYGGPCLPIDNATLAKEIGQDWPLHTDKANNDHLEFQFQQFKKDNPKVGKYVFESVSYKEDVPMIIASQGLEIARKLAVDGYNIIIRDSEQVCEMVKEKYPSLFSFETLQ